MYITTLVTSLFILLLFIFFWVFEMLYESKFLGRYNIKVTATLVYGFLLFLSSEIMLFASFFWAFIDRYCTLSSYTGLWYTVAVAESFDSIKTPIFATLVLVTSGFTYNTAYYYYKGRMSLGFVLFSTLTLVLGSFFLWIQYNEYINLLCTISNTVSLSLFYLITGFHGAHVFVGILFIFLTQVQLTLYKSSTGNMLMLSISLMYWHFVDIIWLVVLTFLYFKQSLDLENYITYSF